MDNVREWLYWRLMQDFGTVGLNDGSYLEGGTKFWPDTTRQFKQWTGMDHKSWAASGVTSCTSFLLWVHKHIVNEGGYKPIAHWATVWKTRKGNGWHDGSAGAQYCDFFLTYPMHVGVILSLEGINAEFLAGGADTGTTGRISWSTGFFPPSNRKLLGYLNIEEYYGG